MDVTESHLERENRALEAFRSAIMQNITVTRQRIASIDPGSKTSAEQVDQWLRKILSVATSEYDRQLTL